MKNAWITALLAAAASPPSFAHGGHGDPSISHLHATDVLLLLGVLVLVLVLVKGRR